MSDEVLHTIELFSGPKVFSSLAGVLGYATCTVDLNPDAAPDVVADTRTLDATCLPPEPLIVWAAPPDEALNLPDTAANWDEHGTPLTPAAELANEVFRSTLQILNVVKPKWWFIENPYGPLRHFSLMTGFNRGYPTRNRITIDHADYGDLPSFRTDIWTNAFWWQPRHEAVSRIARRPANTRVQEVPAAGRRLPAPAIAEMLDQLDAWRRRPAVEVEAPVLNS